MIRILSIGDAMLDVVVKIEGAINFNSDTAASISTHGGGAGANTASWLARLGIESHFYGKVGQDAAGTLFQHELTELGVKYLDLHVPGERTGTVVVIVAGNGERTMFPDPGANSSLKVTELPDPKNFAAISLSGYSLFNKSNTAAVEAMISLIKTAGVPIFFDPASVGTMKSFGREAALDSLSKFDLISLNEEEALFLSGANDAPSALEVLLAQAPIVIVKRGAAGAIAGMRDGTRESQNAKTIDVVDTTGAGDAFNAGFLAEWVRKKDLPSALQSATNSAAQCVSIIGARPRVGT